MPSVTAMITVPRVYPENVYQPAPPAVFQLSRTRDGSWLRNQVHISRPRARKNTVQKMARASAVNTSTTEPAPAAA